MLLGSQCGKAGFGILMGLIVASTLSIKQFHHQLYSAESENRVKRTMSSADSKNLSALAIVKSLLASGSITIDNDQFVKSEVKNTRVVDGDILLKLPDEKELNTSSMDSIFNGNSFDSSSSREARVRLIGKVETADQFKLIVESTTATRLREKNFQSLSLKASLTLPKDESISLVALNGKHSALLLNCLAVKVDNQPLESIGCNKDWLISFDPKPIKISPASCSTIRLVMSSYEPVSQSACIAAIQANPDKHYCAYKTEPTSTYILGQASNVRQTISRSKDDFDIDVQFEDSIDLDFDDFTFTLRGKGAKIQIPNVFSSC